MKGLVFGGCSFTWGQGLYYYSNLPRIEEPENGYTYNAKLVTESHLLYKDSIRYPRLVANHFDTFEVFKLANGGSEDETFDFLNVLFHKKDNPTYGSHLTLDRLDYSESEYIIVQLSQIWRNRYYFEFKGEKQSAMLWPNTKEIGDNQDIFFEWLLENKMSFEDWIELHKKAQINRLKKEFQFYESKGIKCRFLVWETTLLDLIFQDEYLIKRFIKLKFKDDIFDSIHDLQKKYENMSIDKDYNFFGKTPPLDHHPSKLCHEVIAQNIIDKINKDIES